MEILESNKFNIHVHVITISCKRKKTVFLGTWKGNVIVFDCLTWSFLVKWRFNLVQITDPLLYDTCTKVNKIIGFPMYICNRYIIVFNYTKCIYMYLFQVVGFIWGYICQQFSQTMYILIAGFILSCLVSYI